jgi:hypothetical protein
MAQDRGMTVHFIDGSKMSFSFPKQIKHEEVAGGRLERIMDKTALVVEADGALMVIPFTSIKYLQLDTAPQKLPDYVVKEATVLG